MTTRSQYFRSLFASSFFWSLLVTSLLPISLVVGTSLVSSRVVVEKLLTTMAMPTALIWLALWGIAVQLSFNGQKRLAYVGFSVWILFSVVTCPLTSYVLALQLEKGIEERPMDQMPTFGAVITLGGGTTESPSGRAFVSRAGERVVMAARLYHMGKTKLLITTGEKIAGLSRAEKDGAAQTVEIWTGLGIPKEGIKSLGGRNTREEMAVIRKWLDEQAVEGPIGLVTSAWHLPRALRLASQQGLQVIPIPADFAAGRPPAHIVELLPSGGSLEMLEMVLKEYLARIVQR